ncbi:unnamed protein product, partial [marine sediment metagenome]
MALAGSNLFGTDRGAVEARAATVIVAKDGSGDTDDIQEGLNMLPPGGGICAVKEGTFVIKSPITFPFANCTLSGSGSATVISTTGNMTGIHIQS